MHIKASYFSLFVLSFFFLALCSSAQIINVQVKNGEGKTLELFKFYGRNLESIESVTIKGNKAEFKSDVKPGFFKIGTSPESSAIFIMGKDKLKATLDYTAINTFSPQQSLENDLYKTYLEINNGFTQKVTEINNAIRAYAGQEGISREAIDNFVQTQRQIFDTLSINRKQQLDKIANEHKQTFIASLIRYLDFSPSMDESMFLKGFNSQEPNLCNGDMIFTRISMYLQNYVMGKSNDFAGASQKILTSLPAGSCTQELTYQALIENIQPMDAASALTLVREYHKAFPQSSVMQRYATFAALEPEVGDEAPDIALANADGKVMKLSDLRGKVVLIDFWASWCGPCRRENPNVVRVYEQYKDKGFDIFSVSLDNSRDKWLDAIVKDNLTWKSHVSDLKGWQSEGAALYKVRGIPATFLVDAQGKVVGKT